MLLDRVVFFGVYRVLGLSCRLVFPNQIYKGNRMLRFYVFER